MKRLHTERHQMLPNDMTEQPRPGDREIYHKPCYTAHLDRNICGALPAEAHGKEGVIP